ncbi:MAG: protease modulator HflC [Planctomycetota bacterium]|jgi:membrane protease subunit HflC
MKNKTTFILGVMITVVFAIYMVTYQVQFNEVAVVTTFGNATEDSVKDGEDRGVFGNLRLRYPWPIQSVMSYDKRIQIHEGELEEQQTLDKQSVIVRAYVTWRIDDALAFYTKLKTMQQGSNQVATLLRDARSVIGNYNFDDLTNSDPEKVKLSQIEADIKARLVGRMGTGDESWGISVESVGLKQIVLPAPVATTVYARMRSTRQRYASKARSEGDAEAARILANANTARDTILAFAERRAQEIRSEGDAVAANYYSKFDQAPEFAIFLRKLKTYETVLRNNTTFFFDAREGMFQEFYKGPQINTKKADDSK